MKRIRIPAPALLLALVLAGCKQPTDPVFSPSGSEVAYEKGGNLYLKSSSGVRKIGAGVEGPVAWSEDGKKLAFTSSQGTTIYSTDNGRSVRSSVHFPYWWHDGELIGTAEDEHARKSFVTSVDPSTGLAGTRVALDFMPSQIFPAGPDGALVSDGRSLYRFDGLNMTNLPFLKGYLPVESFSDGSVDLARYVTKPKATYNEVAVYRWDGRSKELPDAYKRIDLRSMIKDPIFVVADYDQQRTGMAVVIASIKPANVSDERQLVQIIQRYDLLNMMDGRKNPLPKEVDAKVKRIFNRSSMGLEAFVSGSTSWRKVLSRTAVPKGMVLVRIGMSRDGKKVAISAGDGVTIVNL